MKNGIAIVCLVVLIITIYSVIQRNRSRYPVYFVKSTFGNYNARTVPPFGIYINELQKGNIELINHEKIHWDQYKKKGLIPFYFQYTKQACEYGYDKMPMEMEARANESDYCKENYSECVRIGLAKTVYNPNFRK